MKSRLINSKAKKYLNKNGVYDPFKSEAIRKKNKETIEFPRIGVTKQERNIGRIEDTERNAEALLIKIVFPETLVAKAQ